MWHVAVLAQPISGLHLRARMVEHPSCGYQPFRLWVFTPLGNQHLSVLVVGLLAVVAEEIDAGGKEVDGRGLEGLLPLATNETKGLASMNMCIAYVGEGPVICIKPTKLKQYYYTLLTVTVYENGYFKKIDLAVYYPVKKGGHKCSMSGNGNMFVKEDSDYNLYIHNKTLNNINYCVSIIGASKYINIPSITVEAHPASVLNGLTLTDVATM